MKSYLLHPNGAVIEYRPKDRVAFTLAEVEKALSTNVIRGFSLDIHGEPHFMIIDGLAEEKSLTNNQYASKMLKVNVSGKALVFPATMIKQ